MGAEPAGLNRLARFAERVAADALIYDQGAIPDRIVVVLRGCLQFEVVGEDGTVAVVGEAGPGELAGHIAAVSVRPTSAAARAAEDTILLAIPLDELAGALEDAPGLAAQLSDALRDSAARSGRPDGDAPREPIGIPTPHLVDDQFFFVDRADCPVCEATFEYLRIRTRGLRPTQRDSDLRVSYSTSDPNWYALIVCPSCSYASYHDDFGTLEPAERERLAADTAARRAIASRPLTGRRTADDAEATLELGMRCYAQRRPNERRRAVMLHRRAWLARARGDTTVELEWLARARDAYRDAYERDPEVSDEGALRAAYLIGDLTLRLGDPQAASRWFEVCTRGASTDQSGLVRMARDRLYDAREALKAIEAEAS